MISKMKKLKFFKQYVENLAKWDHRFYCLDYHTFPSSPMVYMCSKSNHYNIFSVINLDDGNYYKPFDFTQIKGNIFTKQYTNLTSNGII